MNKAECICELKQIRDVYAGMRKEYGSCVEALDMAINALEQTAWIPCSERLPEDYGNYLISFKTDEEPDIGMFKDANTGWSACDANGFYWVASKGLEVVAWMPLPEPYKEVNE